jgi:hypothetical protein
MGGIAFFMVCTAVVVLFPVALQLRDGVSRFGEVWGYFVFIAGFLLIAAGDTDIGRSNQGMLTTAGIVATLVGLIVQARQVQNSGTDQAP